MELARPKSRRAALDGSIAMLVAQVACETGCDPAGLLAAPPRVFAAMVQYLTDKAETQAKKSRGKR